MNRLNEIRNTIYETSNIIRDRVSLSIKSYIFDRINFNIISNYSATSLGNGVISDSLNIIRNEILNKSLQK